MVINIKFLLSILIYKYVTVTGAYGYQFKIYSKEILN